MMDKGLLVFVLSVLQLCGHGNGADFIESVHAQGADIAKEMVVEGSQVVWSPFSVVNVLPLINGDESLKVGFKTAIDHFKEDGGVKISRLTTVFTKDRSKVESLGKEYGVEVNEFPASNVQEVVQEKYKEEFGIEPPAGLIPEKVDNVTQLFLTSLLVKAEWATPFKYAPRNRFFLNATHAVKARYMTNVGYYMHGQVPGVDAEILSIPLKNTSTTSFVVVVPNKNSTLPVVSAQFAEAQVGSILQKLEKKRVHLTIPKISVDSQLLLQPMPDVKIIQSGSLRFSYAGIDNRVAKIRRSTHKYVRTRFNKRAFSVPVNRPFIYMIFDTSAGVLNYGEVLLPQEAAPPHMNFRAEEPPQKLSQNAQNLAAATCDRGNQLFQSIKNNQETFAIGPLVLANLMASYATVANAQTQELLFSTLNSKAGMVELYQSICYHNSTSSNSTLIRGGNEALKEKVNDLGTTVTLDDPETSGYAEYNYEVKLRSSRGYVRSFYKNERDSDNVTFYEHIGHVKYVGLHVYDAKAVLLFPSAAQSLLLFVPNERSGLHLVEDGLKDFSVAKLLCQMRDRNARVRLPNFKIQSSVDVLPAFKEVLNVNDIEIEGLGGKKIQSLVHNVTISITGGQDSLKSNKYRKYSSPHRRRPSTRINVDRPFIFYVLDKSGGTLAVGRMTQVGQEEDERVAPPKSTEVTPVGTEVTSAVTEITKTTE